MLWLANSVISAGVRMMSAKNVTTRQKEVTIPNAAQSERVFITKIRKVIESTTVLISSATLVVSSVCRMAKHMMGWREETYN